VPLPAKISIMTDATAYAPLARKEGLVLRELPGELLVYDLQRHEAYCLNETAAVVWRLCDGARAVHDIVRRLETESAAPTEDVVLFALERLRRACLLADHPRFAEQPKGPTRRDLIQKLGVASLLAIPTITSIVAPVAAQARSCIGPRIPVGMCSSKTKGRCCTNNKVCNGSKCV
jgi:hypothetical protein